MNPRLRTALVVVIASAIAVYLGIELAEGSYAWPVIAATVIVATILVRFTGLAADTIFLGFLLVGYVVGNRGFAQLMPAPGLPLLPAESCLLVAVSWRIVVCAFERRLPFQTDTLNWTVLAWLGAGTARVIFDVPHYGMLALRDYALIYYAVFFFLAQHMARNERARRYLIGCFVTGVVALGPMFGLFHLFERFFMTVLTVRGVPLFYYKGDLVATHLAAGSIVVFHWAQGRHRAWAWPCSVGMFLFVMSWDSRASILGAVVASGLLLLARRWRFPAVQGAVTLLALVVVVMLGVIFNNTWANRKLHGVADRLNSMVDLTGSGSYQSEESYFKGDNNKFRAVWWRNVLTETWSTNPLFGLGMGTDLAEGFLQEYYPDSGEDFAARSPHNVFITIFARMGFAGALVWLAFVAMLLRETWRCLRHTGDPPTWSLWCAAWVVLVSATFGVVLEGPMGAVIFWTLLGVANARPQTETDLEKIALVPGALQPATEIVEV